MNKFFSYLYRIMSNKLTRIFLVIFVLVALVYSNYDKNKDKINADEVERIITKIKEDKKNIKKRPTVEYIVVKKNIVPEEELKEEKKEETAEEIEKKKQFDKESKKIQEELKEITNVFLKFKLLEEEYQQRLKEKKINYNKVAKYGDVVYYENVMDFGNPDFQNPSLHLFTKIEKGDFLSEKLVNKKIGQLITYTQEDLVNSLPEDVRDQVKTSIDEKMKEIKNLDVPININILYKVKILDFINKKTIEKFKLEEPQQM